MKKAGAVAGRRAGPAVLAQQSVATLPSPRTAPALLPSAMLPSALLLSALLRSALLSVLLLALLPAPAKAQPTAGTPSTPRSFEFVALGDMPYGPDLIAGPAYRHLIGLVNQVAPPFTVHVGDFKDGTADCGDAEYQRQWAYFQRFDSALVYTPGDNDWLDCHRRGDDPLERLQALRERFFAGPRSMGRRPIAVERQADRMPAFARYRENLRWVYPAGPGGVVFATIHTVGPRNGFDAAAPAVRNEALAREAANAAWIREAFALARSQGAPALVLATQAESLTYPDDDHPRRGVVHEAFAASIRDTLLPLAEAAPFPVLLVHGDFHRHVIDQPFRNARGERITNLWRLQVFGDPRLHAVRVRVQPGVNGMTDVNGGPGPEPFVFTPIFNPMSRDPRVRPGNGAADGG